VTKATSGGVSVATEDSHYHHHHIDLHARVYAPQTASPGTVVFKIRATMSPYNPCNVSLGHQSELMEAAHNDLPVNVSYDLSERQEK
jgi:hypothetical protein